MTGASPDGPMALLERVRFAYPGEGSFALEVERFHIGRGERVACIGPSGCGKTTLVGLIVGILAPDSGRVVLDGRDLAALSEEGRRALRIERVGMVFQEFELLDYLSALDNILLPYHVAGRSAGAGMRLTPAVRERARGLARAMGIEHTLRRAPRRLSHGERQRVAIARALVTGPAILVCDEPTGNLDPRTAATTLDLLFDHAAGSGAAMLVVTHNHGVLGRFGRTFDMAGAVRAGAAC